MVADRKSIYRLDIQGLRAVAVLAVVLFHYDSAFLPGGYIGVDIFLVISGYLITQQLHLKRSSSQYSLGKCLRGFYLGRIKRIAPAYFFMLVLVTVVAKLLFTDTDIGYYLDSLKSTALFASNTYFAHFGDYFAPQVAEQPLLHTWSLAVEMQFYLLLPVLILAFPASQVRRIIPALIVILILVAEWQLRVTGHKQAVYYALYSRVPEFLMGGWLALTAVGTDWPAKRANIVFVIGALLIVGSLYGLDGASSFPGLLSIPPVLGASLIIAAHQSAFSAALRNRPMVWLGFLSYSLYLWHWPFLALIRYYTGSQSLGIWATVLFVSLTLFASCCSFYLVEEPARKIRAIAVTTRRVAVAAVILSVGSLGMYRLALAAKDYVNSSGLPTQYTRYADPAMICHGMDNGHCVKGDLGSAKEILVVGDSHGAMLNGFFDKLGQELHFKARVMTASSCVPFAGFNEKKLPEWAQKSCTDQIDRVKPFIAQASTIFLAGMWTYQLQDATFAPALTRFLQLHADKKIYVLSQVPELQKNPIRMHRFAALGLSHDVPRNAEYQAANQRIAEISGRNGAQFIAFDRLKLFDHAPYFVSQLIYMDESHLNQVGVDAYAEQARPYIRNLVTADGK